MLQLTQFTGTKTIKACPMSLKEAEEILRRTIDTSAVEEDREKVEGYLVEYEDGYRSWSPKEAFEKAYRVSETYFDRMLIEHEDCRARYQRLSDFMCTKEYRQLADEEKDRLGKQLKLMHELLIILGYRIDFAEKQAELSN